MHLIADLRSADMFLVRPQPLIGESLSSWRQRLGVANGFRIYPMAPSEFKHNDADLSPSSKTLTWLSDQSAVPLQDLVGMTLRGLNGVLLSFRSGRAAPRWVIPLHYSRRDMAFGAQYCPACLQQDEHPYFRLRWRLALSTTCRTHSVRLLDRCPRCGQPAWPGSVPITSIFSEPRYSVFICPVCEFDLRKAVSRTETNHINALMSGECFENPVQITTETNVQAVEFGEAIWAVCQLFLRTRPQNRIAAQTSSEGALARYLRESGVHSVEQLPSEGRHLLLDATSRMFNRWPDSFLKFANSHNITSEHFSESRSDLPAWFLDVVKENLAKQRRGVTTIQVESARELLLSQGAPVTKTALGRVVGSKFSKAVNDAAKARTQATDLERIELIRQFDDYMRQPMLRRSSTAVRVRNVLVLLLSIMASREPREMLNLGQETAEEEIRYQISKDAQDRPRKLAVALLIKAARRYAKYRAASGRKRLSASTRGYFESFRGANLPERSIRKALRECMQEIDSTLKRSVQSFWSNSGAPK